MPTIRIENVSCSYYNENTKQTFKALDDLSVTFLNNSINVIVGENGCGKTTLLKCICDLLPYDGKIFFNDINVSKLTTKKRNIGFVTQEILLNPKQNLFDNIAFPLFIKRLKANEIREKVYEISEKLKISNLLNRKITELSKGQIQRASIARCLVKNPDVLIFDEPCSNLDEQNKEIIFNCIKEIMKNDNKITIFVTHSIKDALSLGNNIYVLKDGKLSLNGEAGTFSKNLIFDDLSNERNELN